MKLRAMKQAPLLAAGVAAGAFALAGCGHKQGAAIPVANANDIIGRLQEAQRRSDARACHDLRTDTLPVLEGQVQHLPQNVDSNVRATLTDGVAHLRDLVRQQCATPSQTTTTPTATTPTATTPTVTTPTATTPPPTTRTTPTPTTTTPHTTTTPPTTTTNPGGVPPGPGNGPGGNGPPGKKKHGKGGGD